MRVRHGPRRRVLREEEGQVPRRELRRERWLLRRGQVRMRPQTPVMCFRVQEEERGLHERRKVCRCNQGQWYRCCLHVSAWPHCKLLDPT